MKFTQEELEFIVNSVGLTLNGANAQREDIKEELRAEGDLDTGTYIRGCRCMEVIEGGSRLLVKLAPHLDNKEMRDEALEVGQANLDALMSCAKEADKLEEQAVHIHVHVG